MPSLCNCTLSSSPDRDKFQYWSSFAEKPFCQGERLQLYKGKLNGRGPRGGDFSVVKVFMDQPGTHTRCCKEVAKASTASDWLTRFLAQGQYRLDRVKIAQLQMAPMDQVSMLNKLFSHKRRPSSGEWILLEEMVQERGTLVQFVDKVGRMFRDRPASETGVGLRYHPGSGSSLNNHQLLEAFVHFSYHASGGQLVVCSLEGLEDDRNRLVLKTPVIHSQDKTYGETDQGETGILEVMSRHVCNRHCRRVMGPQHLFSGPNFSSPHAPSPFPHPRSCPSAPFEPELFDEGHVRLLESVASAPPYDLDDMNEDAAHDVFHPTNEVFHTSHDVFHPPHDVFHPHAHHLHSLSLLFQMELRKGIPDDPPPPYTEFIEDM